MDRSIGNWILCALGRDDAIRIQTISDCEFLKNILVFNTNNWLTNSKIRLLYCLKPKPWLIEKLQMGESNEKEI